MKKCGCCRYCPSHSIIYCFSSALKGLSSALKGFSFFVFFEFFFFSFVPSFCHIFMAGQISHFTSVCFDDFGYFEGKI